MTAKLQLAIAEIVRRLPDLVQECPANAEAVLTGLLTPVVVPPAAVEILPLRECLPPPPRRPDLHAALSVLLDQEYRLRQASLGASADKVAEKIDKIVAAITR